MPYVDSSVVMSRSALYFPPKIYPVEKERRLQIIFSLSSKMELKSSSLNYYYYLKIFLLI